MSPSIQIRWAVVTLLPIVLTLWTVLFPAPDPTDHLINGIILSCACVFLFKAILFALIAAHLKQHNTSKRHATLQMLPLLLFAIYIVYYFAS